MRDTLDYTSVNPNQLRHHRARVQDNPMSECPLFIITEDREFILELSMEGTIVFSETHTPSDKKLREFPHMNLNSPHPYDPMKVRFPKCYRSLEDEVGGV